MDKTLLLILLDDLIEEITKTEEKLILMNTIK